MLKRFAPPLLFAPALLLGSCGTYNGGVDSVYQPVVTRTDYVLDLQTSGYSLAPGESQRLAGWLESMQVRYGDRIAIDDGRDGGTAREQVQIEAGRYGLMLQDRAPITVGQIGPRTLRVIVTRMNATVPSCPDMSRAYTPDYSASTTSNFGCAINSNLAAMVADPGDLVRGERGTETSDPATAAKAIKVMRDRTPTGAGTLQSQPTSGGSSNP